LPILKERVKFSNPRHFPRVLLANSIGNYLTTHDLSQLACATLFFNQALTKKLSDRKVDIIATLNNDVQQLKMEIEYNETSQLHSQYVIKRRIENLILTFLNKKNKNVIPEFISHSIMMHTAKLSMHTFKQSKMRAYEHYIIKTETGYQLQIRCSSQTRLNFSVLKDIYRQHYPQMKEIGLYQGWFAGGGDTYCEINFDIMPFLEFFLPSMRIPGATLNASQCHSQTVAL
jgi:hypothetical protein